MGRTRKGTLEPSGSFPSGAPRFRFRLRLGDGTKSHRLDVPEGMGEREARTYVAGLQAEEDVKHGLLDAKRKHQRARAAASREPCEGESADAWHARFLESRGETLQSDSGYRWRKWVSPHLGELPMVRVSDADIERVRDALDAAIRTHAELGRGRGRLAPKAALNIWAVVTTAFKAACQAKQRDLRVRSANPCTNVLPPEKGDSRRKEWIHPREFLLLASCPAVPLEWRELHTIAAYLYLRPGELYELRWRDVDLDVGDVYVTRAWDWEAEVAKAPKTRNGIRHVPIPPPLLPLLRRMREGKADEDKVVPLLEETGKERKTSALLRAHLRTAGVTHPRLFTDDATQMPIGFRSWRDTGITWLALAGVDVVKMQRRAGHDTIQTTMGYVKAAEDFGGAAGAPFPELPPELVWPNDWPSRSTGAHVSRADRVPAQGFEPR
jgi:integrase